MSLFIGYIPALARVSVPLTIPLATPVRRAHILWVPDGTVLRGTRASASLKLGGVRRMSRTWSLVLRGTRASASLKPCGAGWMGYWKLGSPRHACLGLIE